jgi:hypothetical protein
MTKHRGRPKKVWSGHYLGAHLLGLSKYNDERRAGEKHESAIASAVQAINDRYPDFPFRNPDMRKLVAGAQPRGFEHTLRVTEISEDEVRQSHAIYPKDSLPFDASVMKKGLRVSIGSRPDYPRVNAKGPKKKRVY